jgi:hypothetical protein
MGKIIKLTEGDLVSLVKRVLMESESEYIIYGEADHIRGVGMFIYTGNGGYSMVPTSTEFRRRMGDDESPYIFNNRKDADKTIKLIRKNSRPDIRWYIKSL